MTYQIMGNPHRTRTAKRLNKLLKTKFNKLNVRYTRKSIPRYFDSYLIEFINIDKKNFKVTISINPINTSNNFLRVQFNPHAAKTKGLRRIYKVLCKLLGNKTTKKLFYKANITRIDITFDVFDLNKTYYAYLVGMVYSEIRHGDNGRFTQIIGKGRFRLSAYDKSDEQLDSDSSSSDIHPNCFRYEFRIRNLRYSLSELVNKTHNPFLKLHIYDAKFLDDNYFDDSFIFQVKSEGLNKAIHELPTGAKKRRYKRRLNKHYQAKWFDPEKVWRGWLQATTIFNTWKS